MRLEKNATIKDVIGVLLRIEQFKMYLKVRKKIVTEPRYEKSSGGWFEEKKSGILKKKTRTD